MTRPVIRKTKQVWIRKSRKCISCGWIFHPGSPMMFFDYVNAIGQFTSNYMCICCASFIDDIYRPYAPSDFLTQSEHFPLSLWTEHELDQYYAYWAFFWSHHSHKAFAPIMRKMPSSVVDNRFFIENPLSPISYELRLSPNDVPRMNIVIERDRLTRVWRPGEVVYVDMNTGQVSNINPGNTSVVGYVTDVRLDNMNGDTPLVTMQLTMPPQ